MPIGTRVLQSLDVSCLYFGMLDLLAIPMLGPNRSMQKWKWRDEWKTHPHTCNLPCTSIHICMLLPLGTKPKTSSGNTNHIFSMPSG